MKRNKRLLSGLLALALMLSLFPVTALATGDTQPTTAPTEAPKVCESCKGENGQHSTACPTLCTCDPAPAEGEAHIVGCPLNLTPAANSQDGETTGTTTQGTTTTGTTTQGTTEGTTETPTTEAPTTESTAAPGTESSTEATTEATTEPIVELCDKCHKNPCVCDVEYIEYLEVCGHCGNYPCTQDAVCDNCGTTLTKAPKFRMIKSSKSSDADYLELSKKVVNGSNANERILELEAYATQTVTGNPTDVVMVLDQSGSMLHAANVDKGSPKICTANNGTSIELFIQDTMTWDKMLEEIESNPASAAGASHPGYYMMMNTTYSQPDYVEPEDATYKNESKIYALQYKDGKWYRYDSMGCGNVREGKVNRHIDAFEDAEELRGSSYRQNLIVYKSILGVTLDAMYSFLETVEGTDSLRIAMVGFGGPKDDEENVTDTNRDPNPWGTGFYDGANFTTLNSTNFPGGDYSKLANGYFKRTNDPNQMNELWASWGSYGAKRNATYTDLGFAMAQRLFDNNVVSENANRIIILFSDGAPTTGTKADTYATRLKAGKCIHGDTKLKYIPEIYTIGPDSFHTKVSNLSEWATDSAHCFQPDIDGLEEAFKKIAGEIVRKTANLNTGTILLDEITQSFTLPAELTNYLENTSYTDEQKAEKIKDAIKVYTANAGVSNGKITFAENVAYNDATIEVEKTAAGLWNVKVSNFNYTENAVTTAVRPNPTTGSVDFYGKKLVVHIPIEVKPDFLGGNEVPTNTNVSAIYHDGKVVESFDIPKTNVQIKDIIPASMPGNIYLSQQAEIPHVANVGWFRYDSNGDGKITNDDAIVPIDGINNEFVNIQYTIAEKDVDSLQSGDPRLIYTLLAGTDCRGTTGGTNGWTGALHKNPTLTEDKTYYIQINVDPITTGEYTGTENDTSETISVYKPVITFHDKDINLGDSVIYAAHNFDSVVWKHGTKTADETEMGPAPVLTYTYDIPEGAFESETEVRVTSVKGGYGNKTVSDYKHIVDSTLEMLNVENGVTFKREGCEYPGCEMKGKETTVVESGGVNFKIHLNTFNLTIKKTGADLALDPNSSFLFRVTGPNNFSQDVVIHGNGTVVIAGLPIPAEGAYTVRELDWSWRYDPEKNDLTADGRKVKEVTFTNTRGEDKWLDGEHYAQNVFSKINNNG